MKPKRKGRNVFKFPRREKKTSVLDQSITDLALELENGYSDEMGQQAAVMKTLMEAKAIEQKPKLSAETLAASLTTLTGIAMILLFEQKGVITSKSLSFINKPRV